MKESFKSFINFFTFLMNSQEYAKGLMHGHSVWMHDFSFIFLPKSYHMTSEELEYSTQVVWTTLNILMLFVLLMRQSLHIVIL